MVALNEGLKPTPKELPETCCCNCKFYVGNKDKHCMEGRCVFNPPVVFPNPVRKPITNEIVMGQIQFFPWVQADLLCGRFQKKIDTAAR